MSVSHVVLPRTRPRDSADDQGRKLLDVTPLVDWWFAKGRTKVSIDSLTAVRDYLASESLPLGNRIDAQWSECLVVVFGDEALA